MKIKHKINSLFRRKVSFVSVCYNWETREIQVVQTIEDYIQRITYLKDIGMCKRCQLELPYELDICGEKFSILLVSFGDIRSQKFVYGENPISKQFGICMFDYVFLFVTAHNYGMPMERPRESTTDQAPSNEVMTSFSLNHCK